MEKNLDFGEEKDDDSIIEPEPIEHGFGSG